MGGCDNPLLAAGRLAPWYPPARADVLEVPRRNLTSTHRIFEPHRVRRPDNWLHDPPGPRRFLESIRDTALALVDRNDHADHAQQAIEKQDSTAAGRACARAGNPGNRNDRRVDAPSHKASRTRYRARFASHLPAVPAVARAGSAAAQAPGHEIRRTAMGSAHGFSRYACSMTAAMSGPFQWGSIHRRRWSDHVFAARRQCPRTM